MNIKGTVQIIARSLDGSVGVLEQNNTILNPTEWKNAIRSLCAEGINTEFNNFLPNKMIAGIGSAFNLNSHVYSFENSTYNDHLWSDSNYNTYISGIMNYIYNGSTLSNVNYSSSGDYIYDGNWTQPPDFTSAPNYTHTVISSDKHISNTSHTVTTDTKTIDIVYTSVYGDATAPFDFDSNFGYIKSISLQKDSTELGRLDYAEVNILNITGSNKYENTFYKADTITVNYKISVDFSSGFSNSYLNLLGQFMTGTLNDPSDIKISKIQVLDENDTVISGGMKTNENGDDLGPWNNSLDLTYDSGSSESFSAPEFTVNEGIPTKYRILSGNDTEVFTGDIALQTVWNPLDTLRLTYKFT